MVIARMGTTFIQERLWYDMVW